MNTNNKKHSQRYLLTLASTVVLASATCTIHAEGTEESRKNMTPNAAAWITSGTVGLSFLAYLAYLFYKNGEQPETKKEPKPKSKKSNFDPLWNYNKKPQPTSGKTKQEEKEEEQKKKKKNNNEYVFKEIEIPTYYI